MDSRDILKEYFKLNDEILPIFCQNIHDTLSSRQLGDYLSKLTARMKDEYDTVIESNSGLFEDLYIEAYEELSKHLEKKEITRLDDTNNTIFNLTNEWYNSIAGFLSITKGESRSNKII